MYRIEVQDRLHRSAGWNFPARLFSKVNKGAGWNLFLFHENQHAGGNLSSKLISVPARLFGTL